MDVIKYIRYLKSQRGLTMLDKKANKPSRPLSTKKDRLTLDEIQSETHEEERESSSLCVFPLFVLRNSFPLGNPADLLTMLETTSNLAMKSHMLVALMVRSQGDATEGISVTVFNYDADCYFQPYCIDCQALAALCGILL